MIEALRGHPLTDVWRVYGCVHWFLGEPYTRIDKRGRVCTPHNLGFSGLGAFRLRLGHEILLDSEMLCYTHGESGWLYRGDPVEDDSDVPKKLFPGLELVRPGGLRVARVELSGSGDYRIGFDTGHEV